MKKGILATVVVAAVAVAAGVVFLSCRQKFMNMQEERDLWAKSIRYKARIKEWVVMPYLQNTPIFVNNGFLIVMA